MVVSLVVGRGNVRSNPLALLVLRDIILMFHATRTLPPYVCYSCSMSLVRPAGIAYFEDVVRRCGGDPAAILRPGGLAPGDLVNPERYLPTRCAALAIETAARTLGAPDFGLRLCAMQGIDT